MCTSSISKIINIGLRGLTLASKFLLIFFLARFLEPGELGLYGLISATVGYSLYLLGFDFYTYSTREMLRTHRDRWGGLLKSQVAMTLVVYAVMFPVLSFLFITGLLPMSVVGWFFALLVIEHLAQELGRLLVAMSEPLHASLVLFFRSGLWAAGLTALMLWDTKFRMLEYVLGSWVVGGILAVFLGFNKLRKKQIAGWHLQVDWNWIGRGLKVASALLVATLAIRSLFTIDRYWFESLVGVEVLGAYVLFVGICSALVSFLDAGVFAFIYPELISAHQARDHDRFRRGMRRLGKQTLLLTTGFSLTALLLIGPLIQWLGKPIFAEYAVLFPWLLFATGLYAIGMVPHFGLYAQGRDQSIIYSHIFGVLVFVLSAWVVSQGQKLVAVPVGLCVSFGIILLWKSWCYYLSVREI